MKNNKRSIISLISAVILGVLLLTTISGCDFVSEGDIASILLEDTGFNVNNPGDIAKAASGQTIGNREQEDSIKDTADGFVADTYRQVGDDYLNRVMFVRPEDGFSTDKWFANLHKAREEYQKALEWQNNTDERAQLNARLGSTYNIDAQAYEGAARDSKNPGTRRLFYLQAKDFYREASIKYEIAAAQTRDPKLRERFLNAKSTAAGNANHMNNLANEPPST